MGVLIRVGGRLTALLVFVAVMVLVVTQSGTSPARSQAYSRINHLNTQIETVRRENLVLEELVKFRRSDNFVIGQAKRELGLIESDDIGLEIMGVVGDHPVTLVTLGDIKNPLVLLGCLAFVVMVVLEKMQP